MSRLVNVSIQKLGSRSHKGGIADLAIAIVFGLLCSSISLEANAQTEAQPEVGVDLNFNQTDFMMGVHGGVCLPKWNASFTATFKGRVGSKRVLLETDDPSVLVQYRERRYLLGIQADKRFTLKEFSEFTRIGAFVGAFGGLSFGDYRGTKEKAPVGPAGALMGGPYFSDTRGIIIRLGYMYMPLQTPTVFKHHVFITFSFLIHE